MLRLQQSIIKTKKTGKSGLRAGDGQWALWADPLCHDALRDVHSVSAADFVRVYRHLAIADGPV